MEHLNNFLANLNPDNKMLLRNLEELTQQKVEATKSIHFNSQFCEEVTHVYEKRHVVLDRI